MRAVWPSHLVLALHVVASLPVAASARGVVAIYSSVDTSAVGAAVAQTVVATRSVVHVVAQI